MHDTSTVSDAVLLVVADDPDEVRLIAEAFRDARFTNDLHVVDSGDEALDFVHRRGPHEGSPRPDLVLLDWDLQNGSGEDVLTAIKGDDDLAHLPVIVLSEGRSRETVVDSYESQVNAVMPKPVDPEAFIDAFCTFTDFWLSVVRLPPSDDDS